MISRPRVGRDGLDQLLEVADAADLGTERTEDRGRVPFKALTVDVDLVGKLEAGGQFVFHHTAFHGVRARLKHRQYPRLSDLPSEPLQSGADRCRMVGEVVIYRDSLLSSAQFHSPAHSGKGAQCLNRLLRRYSGAPRRRNRRQSIEAVVRAHQGPSDSTDAAALAGNLKAALRVRLARLPSFGNSEGFQRCPQS